MELPYQPRITDQNISLEKLRPNKSYDNLIARRCYALEGLLDEKGDIRSSFLLARNCPTCHGSSFATRFTKNEFNVVECSRGHLLFVNPILDKNACLEVYKSEEYSEIVESLVEDSHEYRRERFGREGVDSIEEYVAHGLPRRLLEIGCSTGFVLEEASSRNWDAVGTELNPSAVRFGRNMRMYARNVSNA